jgi:hypothetical protein
MPWPYGIHRKRDVVTKSPVVVQVIPDRLLGSPQALKPSS